MEQLTDLKAILQTFTDHKALDFMFDQVKNLALSHHQPSRRDEHAD